MADVNIHLNLEMSPRAFRALVPLLLVSVMAGDLASEAVTLNTYYPAPSGIYTSMISTQHTFLARDGGYVRLGTTLAPPNPLTKMVVMGASNNLPLLTIGTLPPPTTNGSGTAPLEVAVTGAGTTPMMVNGQIVTGDSSYQGGVYFSYQPYSGVNQFLGTMDASVTGAFPGGSPALVTTAFRNGATLISVNSGGFVGVGHTAPGAPLDVYGIMAGRSWNPAFTLP